jgi:3-oxoacyl-[acyl-carrier protein] reductase
MKTGKLRDHVAVVTGASKGIGAGIAKHLAAEGAAIVVNYASSKEDADQVVDQIAKGGGKAIAVQADVTKRKDIERLFAETKRAFNRLDILVNNSGVYQFAPLEGITEEEFHREFNTNVLGLLLATQEAVKHFGAEGGSVINISSAATAITPPTSAIYPKVPWMLSRACWRRSLGPGKSA